MKMKIPLLTDEEGSNLTCPFLTNKEGMFDCITVDCMSWTVVQNETSREDHSGGASAMQELGARYGIRPHRTGPTGSEGLWNLKSLSYCKRLWPMAPPITTADYTSPGISPWGSKTSE